MRSPLLYAQSMRSASVLTSDADVYRMSASCGEIRSPRYGVSQGEHHLATGTMPTDILALAVPLLLLVIAIRRNSGVLAALILLTLFIVRL